MKIKLDADGNAVLDEHGNPILIDDEGKEVSTFSADYVRTLRDEAKNYRLEKNKLKEEFDSMRAKLDSIDFEEIEKIKKEREELETKQLEEGKNFSALKDRLLSEHQKEKEKIITEKDEYIQKFNQLEADFHNTLIMQEVQKYASEAEAFDATDVYLRVKEHAKVVTDEYGKRVVQIFENGQPVVDGSGKPIGIKNRVNEMKTDKATAHLFKGGTPGVNSTSTSVHGIKPGENPWKTGNLTAQSLLYKADPALAKRLASEAGKVIFE